MAELPEASTHAPGARRLHGLKVVTVRWLEADSAARDALLRAGLPWVSAPGMHDGTDPLVAWRAPRERLLVGTGAEPLATVVDALAPGRHTTTLALDASEATAAFELHGPALDDWLARLVDASAVPRSTRQGSRCRLADVAVVLMRIAPDRVWLLVDRPLAPYVGEWIAYTHAGMTSAVAAERDAPSPSIAGDL